MDALKHARQLYRDGAHADAIEFINADPDRARLRPLVEEVAHNLRIIDGHAAAVEFMIDKLPDYPKMYPRWTRMMAHWSLGNMPDDRAAEVCELACSANSTHADRVAMTGGLYFQMHKLFTRIGRDARATELLSDGLALGFIECVYVQAKSHDHTNPSVVTLALYQQLVAAKYLSGEIWTGLAEWIEPHSAQSWITLLESHSARLNDVIGYHQARACAYRLAEQPLHAANALICAINLGANGTGSLWSEVVAQYAKLSPDALDAATRSHALRNAVIYNPATRLALEDLKADILRCDPEAEVLNELTTIQLSEPRLILTIFFELRAQFPLETLLKRFARQIQTEMAQPSFEACAQLWDAYVHGRPLPVIAPPDNHSVKVFVILQMQGAKRVNIARNWEDDRTLMKASAMNTKALRQLHAGLTAEVDPDWGAYLDHADYPNAAAKAIVLDRETKCCFQNRIANSGRFELPDLADDGRDVGVVDSFYTNGRTVFTFAATAPFILVTAGAGSRPFMMYYPAENLIVDLGARLGHMLDDYHMNNLLSRYITRLAAYSSAYNSSRSTVRARIGTDAPPRRLTLNINTAENFAHHVWNFYTGLERQIRFGSVDHVNAIHFAGTEFFGALRDIFPEIAHLPLNTERIEGNVDPVPFDPDALLITLGGYFITTALQDRITRVCQTHVDQDPSALARISQVKAAKRVVWFGLRTGDKSWLGQEAGLIKVIAHVQQRYDDVVCVLDAFSMAANQNAVPAVWQAAFDKLQSLSERIRVAAPRQDAVLNLTGVSLPETILIARETDAYVTPLGTTQHKVGWFTKGQGLIYIPSSTAQLDIMRRPGTWESEGITLPDFIVAAHEVAGVKRDVNDRRANLFNMELNTDDICDWLDRTLG